jgi:oligopeptide transport system ATP-binding protein
VTSRASHPSAPGPDVGDRVLPPLLEVSGLEVQFRTGSGLTHAVRDVSFTLARGEVLAVVGESGSGKSVTSRAVMGLVPTSTGIVGGSVRFSGTELVGAPERRLRQIRGQGIGMVFQDSLDSLNPVYSIGHQMEEIFRVRLGYDRERARRESVSLLVQVGIDEPEMRLKNYPHQFSGGMRQRICIAMAISLQPQLLIADEPTTALDVTVQYEVLKLLGGLQRSAGMGMIFVTHDLAVAELVADRLAVMYAGRIVEEGPVSQVVAAPAHPYTRALLRSQPGAVTDWRMLSPIEGSPPPKGARIVGCGFAPRCPLARPLHFESEPPLTVVAPGHTARCFRATEGSATDA